MKIQKAFAPVCFAAAVMALTACSHSNTYTIEGDFVGPVQNLEGKTVYLEQLDSVSLKTFEKTDSARVQNGSFRFAGKNKTKSLARIDFSKIDTTQVLSKNFLVVEPGTIKLWIDPSSLIPMHCEGTTSNRRLTDYLTQAAHLQQKAILLELYSKSNRKDDNPAAATHDNSQLDSLREVMQRIDYDFIGHEIQNQTGLYFLMRRQQGLTEKQRSALLAKNPKAAKYIEKKDLPKQ